MTQSVLDLMTAAGAEGLAVQADGDRLVIRGPKTVDPAIPQALLGRKAEVMEYLCRDVQVEQPALAADDLPTLDPFPWRSANMAAAYVAPRDWTPEESTAITWFESAREFLPLAPFHLEPHRHVIDPARLYAALATDIAAGPGGSRARMGVLLEDLVKLRQVVGAQS